MNTLKTLCYRSYTDFHTFFFLSRKLCRSIDPLLLCSLPYISLIVFATKCDSKHGCAVWFVCTVKETTHNWINSHHNVTCFIMMSTFIPDSKLKSNSKLLFANEAAAITVNIDRKKLSPIYYDDIVDSCNRFPSWKMLCWQPGNGVIRVCLFIYLFTSNNSSLPSHPIHPTYSATSNQPYSISRTNSTRFGDSNMQCTISHD